MLPYLQKVTMLPLGLALFYKCMLSKAFVVADTCHCLPTIATTCISMMTAFLWVSLTLASTKLTYLVSQFRYKLSSITKKNVS